MLLLLLLLKVQSLIALRCFSKAGISAFIPLSNANSVTTLSPLLLSLPSKISSASVAAPHVFAVTGISTSPKATTLCGT